jgi:hypothetical protein
MPEFNLAATCELLPPGKAEGVAEILSAFPGGPGFGSPAL